MKLLSVVLLLLPLSLCLARVVDYFTFKKCPQFFANPNGVVSPPTRFSGNRFKQICQRLKGKAEFATLYDTANRIPVYSAYKFTGLMKFDRTDKWHTDPELEVGMQDQNKKSCLVNQAVNGDYKNSGYDRGHLAPVFLSTSQNCADATFTLTNAAPQAPMFNRDTWMRTEKTMSDTLTKYCIKDRRFVVTGVVPGPDTGNNNNNNNNNNNKKKKKNVLNNRVRIPSHFWTAFCCLDKNNKPKHSGAYLGENRDDSDVYRWKVNDLEEKLTQLYRRQFPKIPDFKFFAGRCYKETKTNEPQIIEHTRKRNMSLNERIKAPAPKKRRTGK